MKAKVFYGDEPINTIDLFNNWAKGKALTKQVIVHTLMVSGGPNKSPKLVIVVYHPEGEPWEGTVS